MRSWILILPLALSGCLTAETMHCADDGATSCIEFTNFSGGLLGLGLRASMTTLCQAVGAKPLAGECPTEGLIGGCTGDEQEAYDYIEWTYEGGDVTSLEEITCGSDEVRVGPDGNPEDDGGDDTLDDGGDPSACSVDGGAAVSVTFSNTSSNTVTMWWVDTGCNETAYGAIAPAATAVQATFAGHVWIARAGSNDPSGTLLWERTLVDTDDGTTLTLP